jgi:hypothetical protein
MGKTLMKQHQQKKLSSGEKLKILPDNISDFLSDLTKERNRNSNP